MKILVTGAGGFVGKNLVEALKNIRDGKDKTHGDLTVSEIYCYDIESTEAEFENACKNADFVFIYVLYPLPPAVALICDEPFLKFTQNSRR